MRAIHDRILRPLLIFVLCLILGETWVGLALMAQTPESQVVALDGLRISNLEASASALQAETSDHERRLTVIETMLRNGLALQYTSTGGLALLVLDAVVRRKQSRSTD